ncbi:MAG: Crp/Fnr family transcriptional regulator [Candidatus Latescibacteria bacterium]|jgi:CRP-like cAMP-binding protein|nr:Crp/Fnr family transcriptional regulator [Candidatus Latescibacterota bacterium]
MTNDYSDMLRQTAFSEGLTEEELKVISPICHELQFKEGEELFSEASKGSELYIICKGRISVEVALLNGVGRRSERLELATSGMIVGELALVDGSPRSARAFSYEDTTVLEIKSDDIRKIMEEYPRIGYIVMRNLAVVLTRRLRNTNLRLRNELFWSR